MDFLESVPDYWAGPISTIVVVLGSIVLLYPLVWNLTIKQLTAALKAIETAKDLPEVASKIEQLGLTIRTVESGLKDLEERLPRTDEWTEKLESLNRLALDLQTTLDQLPAIEAPRTTATKISAKTVDEREEIGKIWVSIKKQIEEIIEGLHGNRRKTYASITRYRYDEIADMLLDDGRINEAQRAALIAANARFLSLRNRRLELASDDLTKFRGWKKVVEQAAS